MGKCCKVLTWVACALAIIAALCVAIYFIVDDAIDRKTESCLYRHFSKTGLLQKYNVTMDKDPANSGYSDEDCQSYVDTVRKRTLRNIDKMNITDCMKKEFSGSQLESLMLKGVLDKFNRQSEAVGVANVFKQAVYIACTPKPSST